MYLKSPTKGKMISETIKNTCNSIGHVTPCYHPSFADSNCVNTQTSDIFDHIQTALCPDAPSQWQCSHLNEVCVYVSQSAWGSDSTYCNLENTGVDGKDYSNKKSLCAFEV